MSEETKNALIKSVSLSFEDHGILSIWLHLDYGGEGQEFGGYALYNPNFPKLDVTGKFVWRCMEIAGVMNWDSVVGKTIRVKASHSGVRAIGHILKDDWFEPAVELKEPA